MKCKKQAVFFYRGLCKKILAFWAEHLYTNNEQVFSILIGRIFVSRLIFHIDGDAFFASVEQSFNPMLRGRPVIVGGFPSQRGVVHSASYDARAKGVRTGMPLRQAYTLCPEAVFLKGNFRHYRFIAKQLLHLYREFSPRVEFASLDDAYVDMSGTEHLWPDPVVAARAIQKAAWERWHIPVSIGIGTSKLVSRLASGRKKPHGLTRVPPGHELAFLHPLPVGKLPGVGRVTQRRLVDLGITTVRELAQLNASVLSELFGKNGLRLWELANGIDPREVRPVKIPKQLSRETSFEDDVAEPAVVLSTIRYLVERLAQKLREKQLVAGRVGIKVRYAGFQSFQKFGTLSTATADAAKLGELAEMLFRALPIRRERFRFVQVQVSDCEPAAWQRQLFSFEQKQQTLNRSIDAIRSRYGFMAILPANTLLLQTTYQMDSHGYILHTPSLSQ